MSLHFAAARHPMRSPIARALGRRAIGRAANDDGPAHTEAEGVFRAALVHFSAHGLGAARAALDEAQRALEQGDRQGYEWWLGICSTLDRRLAATLAHDTVFGALTEK